MTKAVRWIVGAGVVTLVATVPVGAAGDKIKGEKIYKEQQCVKCHRIGSAGAKMGPELTKVGASRDKAWLVFVPHQSQR